MLHIYVVWYYCIIWVTRTATAVWWSMSDAAGQECLREPLWDSICSQLSLAILDLDKLASKCAEWLEFYFPHMTTQFRCFCGQMHSIKEHLILTERVYTHYISKRQPRPWDILTWIHITSVMLHSHAFRQTNNQLWMAVLSTVAAAGMVCWPHLILQPRSPLKWYPVCCLLSEWIRVNAYYWRHLSYFVKHQQQKLFMITMNVDPWHKLGNKDHTSSAKAISCPSLYTVGVSNPFSSVCFSHSCSLFQHKNHRGIHWSLKTPCNDSTVSPSLRSQGLQAYPCSLFWII